MVHAPAFIRFPVLLLVVVALSLLTLAVRAEPQVLAGPPPEVTTLNAEAVERAGIGVSLTVRLINGQSIAEPRSTGPRFPEVLAVSPDGASGVISISGRGQVGPLAIVRPGGGQLHVAIPGVVGAAYAPSGEWLAAVDLAGALWRVETDSGAAARLADGPFASRPAVVGDRVLGLRLSSVEAPSWSQGVWVDPTTGQVTALEPDAAAPPGLVYGLVGLADGAVALVRHEASGGVAVVGRAPDGSEVVLATLSRATSVDVSRDGRWVSWTAGGRVELRAVDGQPLSTDLGEAIGARFSPDSRLLLLWRADGADVVDVAGVSRAEVAAGACWLGDGRGCQP